MVTVRGHQRKCEVLVLSGTRQVSQFTYYSTDVGFDDNGFCIIMQVICEVSKETRLGTIGATPTLGRGTFILPILLHTEIRIHQDMMHLLLATLVMSMVQALDPKGITQIWQVIFSYNSLLVVSPC